MLRALCLDVGTRTVGLALSDELGLTAQPHSTLRRSGHARDVEALALVAQQEGCTDLVVGLPLNMDGTEGPRATAARKLGDALGQATALPVHYWDERLTTVAAQRALLEADVSRAKRKEVIDQVAACLILEGWLTSRRA